MAFPVKKAILIYGCILAACMILGLISMLFVSSNPTPTGGGSGSGATAVEGDSSYRGKSTSSLVSLIDSTYGGKFDTEVSSLWSDCKKDIRRGNKDGACTLIEAILQQWGKTPKAIGMFEALYVSLGGPLEEIKKVNASTKGPTTTP